MRALSPLARSLPAAVATAIALSGCQSAPQPAEALPRWAKATPAVVKDPQMERKIQTLLAKMSLEQKVGQMIQADIGNVTAAEIREYRLGSVLNGGGQTPDNDASATAQDWAEFADKLYRASMADAPDKTAIPLIWGTDAVHGHGNVRGATLYPHNIALGATRNEELVRIIAEATALEVAATGLDWNFAPTIAVVRDIRWGRTYEGFSEDPNLVAEMGAAAVKGLQGSPNSNAFLDDEHVLATAKHFIGDGGTRFGDDQGYAEGDEARLLRLHLPGYISAIEAGAQTVMASYSYWNGLHAHANKRLLTGLLKDQLGFDGLVVSDWQAIAHVPGCTIDNCAEAVNAGVDLFMIPNAPDWQNFLHNTLAQVRDGTIPLARIDDAVSRILRVKMRAGLWEKPSPAQRPVPQRAQIVGNAEHRQLARQAVRESLVLLKNDGVLPLNPSKTILVAGTGADNLSMQAGGWSVTWQGNDNSNDQYPGATSIWAGVKAAVEAAGGEAIHSVDGTTRRPVDAAIVVFGEQPYAEMLGDVQNLETLEVEQQSKESLKLIHRLRAQGIPVVAVLLSGRPLWVNKELNAADAFVAAWQPGTEGAGIADVLLRQDNGSINYDFIGKLSFSWPAHPCDSAVGAGGDAPAPLFPFGYGLNYTSPQPEWATLNESTRQWRYGCRLGSTLPSADTLELSVRNGWQYRAEHATFAGEIIDKQVGVGPIRATPEAAKGGITATWDGSAMGRVLLRKDREEIDVLDIFANNGALVMDVNIQQKPQKQLDAVMFTGVLSSIYLDISDSIDKLPLNQWQRYSIDLDCFTPKADMTKVNVPFGLQTAGEFKASIANVRLLPNAEQSATVQCPERH